MENRLGLRILKIAVLICITVFSNFCLAQTPAQEKKCLAALNNHKMLKFSRLSEPELKKLDNLFYGVSNNELALFLLTSGRDISENCPQSVTEYFVGKFDTPFILNVKKLAAQGNCETIDLCNKRAREYETIVKALNGGSAGLSRANSGDLRYTGPSNNAKVDSAEFSVCCSGPMGGKVNARDGGGYCENNDTSYPCFGTTADPLKDSDPGRAAFYKKFNKQRLYDEWIRKYGGGSLAVPVRSSVPVGAIPATTKASGVGR